MEFLIIGAVGYLVNDWTGAAWAVGIYLVIEFVADMGKVK